jgi:hypothetical protein
MYVERPIGFAGRAGHYIILMLSDEHCALSSDQMQCNHVAPAMRGRHSVRQVFPRNNHFVGNET